MIDARQFVMHVVLLAAATLLAFSNTLGNDYHLDSIPRVKDNTEIERFWPPGRFFTDVRTGSVVPQITEYRPLAPLSFALQNEFVRLTGADRRAVHHLGNILVHLVSVVLAYALFRHCLFRAGLDRELIPDAAFAAALIFAVHPVSGSAVNYIAARDLLLMSMLFLGALYGYMRMREHGESVTGWAVVLVLLLLAWLAKQNAIMAFAVVFLYEWCLRSTPLSSVALWRRVGLVFIPTVAYLAFRTLWISAQDGQELRIPLDFAYPLTMLDAHVFYYLRNVIWPFEMRGLPLVPLVSGVTPGVVVGGSVVVAAVGAALWLRERWPVLAFCILAYAALFALTSSIFPFRYIVVDYRQYLSFVFLSLLIAWAAFTFLPERFSRLVTMVFAAYAVTATVVVNRHWETAESYWGQSIRYGGVAQAHNNYALAVQPRDPVLAESHLRTAVSMAPTNFYANINLALAEIRRGETDAGLARLRKVIAFNPARAISHYWLAQGLELSGDVPAAVDAYLAAAELDPRRLDLQYAAAQALGRSNRVPETVPYLERIEAINTDYRRTAFMLGFAAQRAGDLEAAIDYYQRYLGIDPADYQAGFNLGVALAQSGQCSAAIPVLQRLVAANDAAAPHFYLARCHEQLGDEVRAAEHQRQFGEANDR